ncbi:hypothetical protein [Anatilimnocola floriformis]|uniref:hypothetical protein n=1 Tax=Anatilimnocola floriformis TaxID=2948575 RepID=UPI0020C3717B|nr:hypothetical protein [Anatilimnocola floriformis]
MPRKPKIEPKRITVVIDGSPISVTLHPPSGRMKAWYVYWAGLGNSKSTGERELTAAVAVAETMLRNGGERPMPAEGILSDEEFQEIQRHHFSLKQSKSSALRSAKSLKSCLEAIDAFKRISKLPAVSLATPDDCSRFEKAALKLPKSWRLSYPKAKKDGVANLSSNTVAKWSTALAAAFERANINGGRKCVRGVVPTEKLLQSNPWRKYNPIVAAEKPKRHLSNEELLSIIDFLEGEWAGIAVAAAAVKTCLWSWTRLSEFTNLSWDDSRPIGQEWHFRIVGKWGMVKWARLPLGLIEELQAIRTASPFVFASYSDQLRSYYLQADQKRIAAQVNGEFSPSAFASWFHERITQWAKETNRQEATTHALRKTSLQHALRGEDVSRLVAKDAKLTEAVMTAHYTSVEEEQLRQASNRAYHRIVLSLPQNVAIRYGYRPESTEDDLKRRLSAASVAEDWSLVGKLAAELGQILQPTNGEKKPLKAAGEGGVSENI